jgi:hypothetical protein
MQADLFTLLNHSGGFNDGLIAIFPCFIWDAQTNSNHTVPTAITKKRSDMMPPARM